jgi:hypothetical protein
MSHIRILTLCAAVALAAPVAARAQETKAPRTRPAAAAPARPANATAQCNDGTWWTNATRQGACSSHRGVKEWLAAAPAAGAPPANATARCKDGTYWTNATRQGACSAHGGVKDWLGRQAGEGKGEGKGAAESQKAPAGTAKRP